jgi:HAD superfamily hydrolase (TIGR01490 family)
MNLALFDFDGTITVTDSFVPFLRRAVSRTRQVVGGVVLLPIIMGYKSGVVSASRTRAKLVSFGLRGRREKEVRQIGATYAIEVLPGTIRPKAMERIEWHKSQGDDIVVVSAALNVYLEEWCRRTKLAVVCTQLESSGGILTGRYIGGDCTGQEKSRRLLAKYDLKRYKTVYGYGDTSEDDDLLSLADKKFHRWEEFSGRVHHGRKSDHVDQEPNR